jgi:hypothetical protein
MHERHCRSLGCKYVREGKMVGLVGYNDAELVGDGNDRKSTNGMVFFFGRYLITLTSQNYRVVALSSYEVEYIFASTEACKDCLLEKIARKSCRVRMCNV